MFHAKKPSTSSMNSHERPPMCVQGDSGLVLTTDPKPRLRWTVELHERFVDAVTQLGGPDKATPKTIMRVMGVKGLTLYHLKSHLQKFRLGKQPQKDYDHSIKDGERASTLELQRSTASSSGMMARSMNEMQMEVQRRLHEQLEVQRHLQLRIEAQAKYMQTIFEKACQTLAGENNCNNNNNNNSNMGAAASASSAGNYINNKQSTPNSHSQGGVSDISSSNLKEFCPPLNINFPSLQDLNIYGENPLELHHHHHHHQPPSLDLDAFDNSNNLMCSLGGNKKRPSPYNNNSGNGKSPLIWSEDHNLDDPHISIAPPLSIERSSGGCASNNPAADHLDSMPSDHHHIFEAKPVLTATDLSMGDKKFDAKLLDRPSPRRAATVSTDRSINHHHHHHHLPAMINSGVNMATQGRNSPFG